MAVLMCVTSVPQSSFLSMAAEKTEISTEPMTLAASEEEALEVENVVETEAAIEEIVPETESAAAEILVPETVMQEPVETETVVSEVMETESETPEVFETETTVPETAATETTITEAPTEVITEAPETETSVPETVLPETESEETEAPETTAPETETESETEGVVVLTGEGEEAAVTNTLEPEQTVNLDFNGNDTVECQYTVPTSGKYCLKFSADSEIWVSVDGLNYGNVRELERDCLLEAGKTYTLQVEKYYSGQNDFPVSVSLNETKSIASLNITPGTTAYPKSDGQAWYFRDWKVQVVFTDGSTSNTFGVLDMMCDDETGEMMNPYTSKYNIGVEIYKKDSESAFTNSEYEGDEPWEVGDYQVVFTYPEGRTERHDFKIASWDEVYQDFTLGAEQSFAEGQYWKFTIPEGEGGEYSFRTQNCYVNLYDEDGSSVSRWDGCSDIYQLEAGKTYHFSPEGVNDGAMGILEKLDSWDMTSALERTKTNGYCVLTPAESGTYHFIYENDSAEGDSQFQIYDKNGYSIDSSSVKLTGGERYLLWFGFYSSSEEEGNNGRITATQTPNLTQISVSMVEGVKIVEGDSLSVNDIKITAAYENGQVIDVVYNEREGGFLDGLGNKFDINITQKDDENDYYYLGESLSTGNYTVYVTCAGTTGSVDFEVIPLDSVVVKLEPNQTVVLKDNTSYFKLTIMESGYYLLKKSGEYDEYPDVDVKKEDGSWVDILDGNQTDSGWNDVCWLDANTTYDVEAKKAAENQTICVSKLEKEWDATTALPCLEEDGCVYHTFQVKEDGVYSFSGDGVDWKLYSSQETLIDFYKSSVELFAGQTYLLMTKAYEDGSIRIEKIPKVTAITSVNIKGKDKIVENTSLQYDMFEIGVSYEDGSVETINGLSDRYGNRFDAGVWDPVNEIVNNWNDPLEAGNHELSVTLVGGNLSATCEFTVRSLKDAAGENPVTRDESKQFIREDKEQFVFFQYTADETGTWNLDFNRSIEKLSAEDEQGKQLEISGYGNHYTIQLEAGKTVYFMADAGEDWKAVRVKVTKDVSIVKVTLGTNETYYIGLSELDIDDFYIDVTYTDGSTRRLEVGELDGYGNSFSCYASIDGSRELLDGIPVERSEYQIDAYLWGEVKATLQLACKEVDLNEIQGIKEDQLVKMSGDVKKQYYWFIPEKDGYYNLTGIHPSNRIYSQENGQWEFKGYQSAKLEKGKPCLLILSDRNGEFAILAGPDTTSGTSLTLGQAVTISGEKEYSFSFKPEKDAYYCLKKGKNSEGNMYLSIYQKDETTSEYNFEESNIDELSSYLRKDVDYIITALYKGESSSLMVDYSVSSKIVSMNLWSEDGLPWGITGLDTLEDLISHFVLSVGFEGDTYTSYTRISLEYHKDQLHDGGVLTDEYGNQYTISLKQTTGNNYKLRVTNGDVYVEKELVFVDPDELEVLTEGSSKKISATQADETEKVEIFRFVPTADGFYKFTAKADGDLLTSIKVSENDEEVSRDSSYDGYQMQKGKTYLVAVTYTRYSTGTITVEASNVTEKAIIDVELEGELPDMNAVADVCYPDLEGTKLKFTYADGTTEIKTYTWDGEEGIEATANMITSKTCRIRFEAAGYYVEKDIPMLSKAEVPVLPGEGMKNVQFSDQGTTKTFSFTVGADGVYQPCITDEKGEVSDFLCRIQEDRETQPEISEDGRGHQLKAGVTYYLVVKAKGSQNISIQKVDAACEHEYVWQTTTEPTCTTAGNRSEICKLCGDVRSTESIPALGHDLTTVIEKNATCGANGSKHVECSRGDYKEASVVIPATGKHTYTTKVDIAATCGSAGSQHEECTVCHTQKAATAIPATGQHQYVEVTDTVPTCGSTGTQHKECSICHTRENAETVAATGNHTFTTIVDRVATCGAAGSQHEECTVCHARKEAKAIPATGNHKFKTVVDRAATCGTAGSQHEECTVCHTKKAATAIAATGKHTYGAYETVKAATVFAAGSEECTCSVCGNRESRSIKKLTAKISVSYKSVSVVAGSSVAGPKVTYAKGDKITSWKTSNKTVATVAKNGKITGKKAGTATITVTLKSKKSAKIKVTVKKKVAATRVKLNKTSLTLKKGKSFQLKATVTPQKTTDKVTYKTSNKKIVTVTSKGKLVAKKKGKATITVTVGKKKAVCRVVVK